MVTILEPSFETIVNWTYEENDPSGILSGAQSSNGQGLVDGIYTYQFALTGGKTFTVGEWMGIKQSITIPSNFAFKIHFHNNGFSPGISFKIYVDTTEVYNYDLSQGNPPFPGIYTPSIDLSSYSGIHDIKFRVHAVSTESSGNASQLYIDNIQEGWDDIYVNSSTGNDTNTGHSCSAGNPVLTFGKAYSLISSIAGTIHVCNSGADFSGETVTLNKSFSMDLNGLSGNFYGPKAS